MRILGVLACFALSFTVSFSVPRGEYGEIKIFQSPATYNVESMVLLNEAARKNKEVGYKVTGSLDVHAVWGVDTEFLLKFVVSQFDWLYWYTCITYNILSVNLSFSIFFSIKRKFEENGCLLAFKIFIS